MGEDLTSASNETHIILTDQPQHPCHRYWIEVLSINLYAKKEMPTCLALDCAKRWLLERRNCNKGLFCGDQAQDHQARLYYGSTNRRNGIPVSIQPQL